MRVESRKYTRKGERLGVAPILMAVIIVVIVLVAAVAVYYTVVSSSTSTSGTQSSSQRSTTTGLTSSSSTTSSVRSSSSTTSSVHVASTSSARSSSTGSSGISTYSVTFNFSLPLGPSGERVLSNDTVQLYNTTQFGSGSFTFSISASNQSGSGSGHGTLVATTTGFCSGKITVPYTFQIPDATTLLGNLTIFIGDPTPGNFTVPLTCTGPMTGVSTANNITSFLAEYPNEITVAAIPVTVDQHLSGNINYYYDITKTS